MKSLALLTMLLLAACGARTGLEFEDASAIADAAPDAPFIRDAGSDAPEIRDAGSDAGDCAAHPVMPGDLIKGSGPAVYYVASDHRRYVFPNEDTFYSWYPDFSRVCTIPDTALALIPIGGNVTIRPGTFLVKITTDPKAYAISPHGELHWVPSESLALRLYGPMWAHLVQDVPDSFFVNYSIGAEITDPIYPDGQLVTYAGSPDIYVIERAQRWRLLPGAFEANGFQRHDPRDPTIPFVIQTDIVFPDGVEPIAGRVARYAEPVCPTCP